MGYAVTDDSTIGFNFLLSWTLHADATFLLLQVCPHVGEARQKVLILCQLYLGLRVGCAGALGKDVED